MRRSSIALSVFLVLWFLFFSITLEEVIPLPPSLNVASLLTGGVCEAAVESEYVIGPEDVLSISVRERSDLSGTFIVGPDGAITFPLLGEVKAAGMTPSQLSKELNRRLSVYRAGEAAVAVLQYNSRKIFVVGAVTKPGKYAFSTIPSIWDVLSEAGGPTEAAILSAVQVIRAATGEIVTVDVRRILSGETADQVKLQPGDTVRVPSKISATPVGNAVYVLGEVRTPGSYEISLAGDVVAALVAAGGPTEMAQLKKLYLVRRSGTEAVTYKINLEKFLKEGLTAANPDLRPGDTIMVPRKRTTAGTVFSLAGVATILSAIASLIIVARD